VAAVALGARLHRAEVRAGVGLGHGQALHALAADRRQEIALDLRTLAGAQDVGGPRHRILQGHRGAAELALHEGEGDMVEPAAAELLRHVGGVEAGREGALVDLLDELRADLVGAFDLFLIGHELGVDELPHAVDQQLLLRCQAELHGAPLERTAQSRGCGLAASTASGTDGMNSDIGGALTRPGIASAARTRRRG
jgi:hypothetical protein